MEQARRFDWSAFLVDLHVPHEPGGAATVEGGRQFLVWLEGEGRHQGVPRLVVSGHLATPHDAVKVMKAGASDINLKDDDSTLTDLLLQYLKDCPLPSNPCDAGAAIRELRFVGRRVGRRHVVTLNPNRVGEGEEVLFQRATFGAILGFAARAFYYHQRLVPREELSPRITKHLSEFKRELRDAGFDPDQPQICSLEKGGHLRLRATVSFDHEHLHEAGDVWLQVARFTRGR